MVRNRAYATGLESESVTMPYPPNYRFVRQSGTGSGSGANSVTMTDQNAGDCLLAVMASIATTEDFTDLPAQIQDTIGNTYNLMYTNKGHNTTADVYNCVALYVCPRANGNGGYILDMPSNMQPADVLHTWMYILELETSFANQVFDAAGYEAHETANFVLATSTPNGSDDAVIAFVADAGLTANPVLSTYTNSLDTFGDADNSWGWQEDSILNGNETPSIDVLINGATDAFGFIVAMEGTNSTGGSAQGTAAFWISKGPNPVVPNEGRAIATVEIDCTNMQIIPLPLMYDEFSSDNTNELTGAVVVEFDLQRLNMSLGKGLSDCKVLSFYYRPTYNDGEDLNAGFPNVFPAFVTNLTTRQTVICWGINDGLAGNNTGSVNVIHQGVVPFLANVNGMKVRVLIPQATSTPNGKLTLQFLNFDVPSYGPIAVDINGD
jgi:hypothetical protein